LQPAVPVSAWPGAPCGYLTAVVTEWSQNRKDRAPRHGTGGTTWHKKPHFKGHWTSNRTGQISPTDA